MKIKFSKELEWLEPFTKRVKNIVPVQRLEKVISGKPRPEQIQHCHAQLVSETYVESGRVARHYITLNLYYLRISKLDPLKRTKQPFSKIDLLETYAHELAHLKHKDHTPQHKKLENRLCSLFMTMLEKQGYKSEEHELKHNRPRF